MHHLPLSTVFLQRELHTWHGTPNSSPCISKATKPAKRPVTASAQEHGSIMSYLRIPSVIGFVYGKIYREPQCWIVKTCKNILPTKPIQWICGSFLQVPETAHSTTHCAEMLENLRAVPAGRYGTGIPHLAWGFQETKIRTSDFNRKNVNVTNQMS